MDVSNLLVNVSHGAKIAVVATATLPESIMSFAVGLSVFELCQKLRGMLA